MKKIVASVGLAALGTSGLYSAPISGLTEEGGKNWSVAATLRGFYDDNINTAPSGPAKQDAFGFEISPSANYGLQLPQTTLTLAYVYSFKYYDHKPIGDSEKYDQQHIFNAAMEHSFSERYKLSVRDSFAIGQEPDVLRSQNSFATFQRISGDNIRNYGAIVFNAELTRLLGLEIGYDNSFYDYSQNGANFDALGRVIPSNSGLLDRIENSAHLDTRWMFQPETVGVVGYRFRDISYTADELIGFTIGPGGVPIEVHSDDRNFRQHSFYVGADHTFNPNLTGAVRAGASYVDYYNETSGSSSDWGPYAMANLRYTYAPQSYAEIGVSQDFSATDVTGVLFGGPTGTNILNTTFTSSQEATVVYGSVNHQLTAQLKGSVLGQFQYSSFRGGSVDGDSERFYLVGVNLTYQFTPHFSSEIGYNFDKLDSDIGGRSFDRNRVYIGVTGRY